MSNGTIISSIWPVWYIGGGAAACTAAGLAVESDLAWWAGLAPLFFKNAGHILMLIIIFILFIQSYTKKKQNKEEKSAF